MPWTLGQTAETVGPGRLEAGLGMTALAPPSSPRNVLPVPQLWVRFGVTDLLDAGVSYTFPATGYADLKRRLSGSGPYLVSASAGAGMQMIPAALDAVVYTPFLGTGILASVGSAPRGPIGYAAVRGFIPFHDYGSAATLWLSGTLGAEWRGTRLRVGPELGLVSSVLEPGDLLVTAGVSARWMLR